MTRDKKSGILLLRQQLKQRFPQISQIDVGHVYAQKKLDLKLYDCIVVTERDLTSLDANAIYVKRLSLDEDEERRIAFALAGFDVERDLISRFSPKLFTIGHAQDKGDALLQLFGRAEAAGIAGKPVLDSIVSHEAGTSSYFGNRLAIPHPEQLTSDCTQSFFSVLVLDEPIAWEYYEVDLAMLMVLHEDDPVRFQMWNYLSLMISKPEYVDALRTCRSYQAFIGTVRSIFKLELNS